MAAATRTTCIRHASAASETLLHVTVAPRHFTLRLALLLPYENAGFHLVEQLTSTEQSFILLNMCSAKARAPALDHSDLTARSRIRDAAIRLFATDGFAATSVRVIADEAGVSPALVMHHFGSKEGLRRACDEHVLMTVIGEKAKLLDADLLSSMHGWLTTPERFKGAFDYVARTLSEPSELGTTLFEGLVTRTRALLAEGVERGTTRTSRDPEMQAIIIALHGLAPLVLQHHLGSYLGHDGLSKDVIQRMTLPVLELYTHGLYTTSSYLDAATAALEGGSE